MDVVVDVVREAKLHAHELLLWPQQWKEYKGSAMLTWQCFPFDESIAASVPSEPGVYAFLIEPRLAANLPASYPMYVGKTDRSLRQRFREYHGEAKNPNGRVPIIMLISMYVDFLYFYCAPLDSAISPAAIEDELIEAIVPPANRRFPASVRRVLNAW